MQTLTVEDMRRIVGGAEPFLLVDVRAEEASPGTPLPRSIRLPFSNGFATAVLERAGGTTSPVVVYGDRLHSTIVEKAADALTKAGFAEVWCYGGGTDAWFSDKSEPTGKRHNVVSNPDEAHAQRQAIARQRE
jgi:rhodanese-related sulfurtransferase